MQETREVIGYARVSTDLQDLRQQEARIREYCGSKGWVLVDFVADKGRSGTNLDRPGIQKVLGILRDRKGLALLVAKVDRLTRNVGDAYRLFEEYFSEAAGNLLLSASEHVDTRTASGRLSLFILVVVSQWEVEVNHERTRATMGHKAMEGERTGSVPFGYDLDEEGPRNDKGRPLWLVRNDSEQAVIALIRDWGAEGRSHRQIAAELESLRVPTKRANGPWRHSSVARILNRKTEPETRRERPKDPGP